MRTTIPLIAASLAPMLALGAAARADDRALCGEPGLDLVCATVGPGFNVVPQEPGSLRTFYVTVMPRGGGPSPASVVYGGSGYTSVWGAGSLTGRTDGSMASWSGTAKVARLLAGHGTIAVGTGDVADQSSYLDMGAGHGAAFIAGRDIVVLGPGTTVEAYHDGRPFHSSQSVIGYGRHGATARIVTNRPFVRRTVSTYSGTCLWWGGYDSVCLAGYQARRPIAVYVDSTDRMRRVVEAGRSPATAEAASPRLAGILRAQAGLRPRLY